MGKLKDFMNYVKGVISEQQDIEKKPAEVVKPAEVAKPVEKISATLEEETRKNRRAAYLDKQRESFSSELSAIPRSEIKISNEKISRRKLSDMPEIKISNITRATKIDKLFPLVVIDTETTGIQVRTNDIIEVSAIKFDVGFVPISCFTTLLKPRKPISAEATEINNITDDMVKNCPEFYQVAPSFSEYIEGCNIVGHNLIFDIKHLFVCGANFPEKAKYFDTLDLAKKVLRASNKDPFDEHDDYDVWDYKLVTLCEYYNIYRNDAHRSLSDCFATAKLLQHLIEDKTS